MKNCKLVILLASFLYGCCTKKQDVFSQSISFAYCLQADKNYRVDTFVKAVQASTKQGLIIDAFYQNKRRWKPAEIKLMQDSAKTVLCYLSIGEAESYRPYWQKSWKTEKPAFLLKENPNWAGNYRVKYWTQFDSLFLLFEWFEVARRLLVPMGWFWNCIEIKIVKWNKK